MTQERDFHSLADAGQAIDALETGFSKFESELSVAIERRVAAGDLSDEQDRAFILNLIALIAVKNPRTRARATNARETTVKAMVDLATSSEHLFQSEVRRAKVNGFIPSDVVVDRLKMRAMFEAGGYEIRVSPATHVLSELDVFENVLPLFFRRSWRVLLARPEGSGFITCDQPVCLLWSAPPAPPKHRPLGYGLPGTVVLFAISERMALIGNYEGEETVSVATEDEIASFNGAMISNARRQIYARDADFLFRLSPEASRQRGDLIEALRHHRLPLAEDNSSTLTASIRPPGAGMSNRRAKGKTCTYCGGLGAADTADHVFAREFFPLSKRGNLPKVPACQSCNGSKAKLEHYLTAVLPFGSRHEDAAQTLEDSVPARLAGNEKLRRELAAHQTYSVQFVGGRFVRMMTLPLRGESLAELFAYIARGLALYEFGVIIPQTYNVRASMLRAEGNAFLESLIRHGGNRVERSLGDGLFDYSGLQSVQDSQLTVWKFRLLAGLQASDTEAPGELPELIWATTSKSPSPLDL